MSRDWASFCSPPSGPGRGWQEADATHRDEDDADAGDLAVQSPPKNQVQSYIVGRVKRRVLVSILLAASFEPIPLI